MNEEALEPLKRLEKGDLVYIKKDYDDYVGVAIVIKDDHTAMPYNVRQASTGDTLWFSENRLVLLDAGYKQYTITELATILARKDKLYANNGDTLSLTNGEFLIGTKPMKLEEQALRELSYVNHTKDFEIGKVYKVWDNKPANHIFRVIKEYNPSSIWKYTDNEGHSWQNAELVKQTA